MRREGQKTTGNYYNLRLTESLTKDCLALPGDNRPSFLLVFQLLKVRVVHAFK